MSEKNYWKLQKFSIFYTYYAFIDSQDYLADQLFVKHKVKVDFGKEYCHKGSNYLVIFCKVRKTKKKRIHPSSRRIRKQNVINGSQGLS